MSIMNKHLKEYILHYSDVYDKEVSKMVINEVVPSEKDAKRLLSFIDVLFEYSSKDMEAGKIILGELASTYDAEKATLAILSILRDNNYDALVDNCS